MNKLQYDGIGLMPPISKKKVKMIIKSIKKGKIL